MSLESMNWQKLLKDAGIGVAEVDEAEAAPDFRQMLIEAGLSAELVEDLDQVVSPEWMQELSLQELFALATGEEIGGEDEDGDSENRD